MTGLGGAFTAAVARLVEERGDVVLVGPPEAPSVAAVRGVAPDRAVAVAGRLIRSTVGAGLAESGHAVITVGDASTRPPPPGSGCQVVVLDDPASAQRWWAGGARVVLPAHPADVAVQLEATLRNAMATVMLLHASPPPESADEAMPAPNRDLRPRLLARGQAGIVAAGGALALALPVLGRMLAGRGVPVTTVAVDTALPLRWPDPVTLSTALLVGPTGEAEPGTPGWTDDLVAVGVTDRRPRALMDAVAARLRVAAIR